MAEEKKIWYVSRIYVSSVRQKLLILGAYIIKSDRLQFQIRSSFIPNWLIGKLRVLICVIFALSLRTPGQFSVTGRVVAGLTIQRS